MTQQTDGNSLVTVSYVREMSDLIAEEVRAVSKAVLQLAEIVEAMNTDAFTAGRVDQMLRDYRGYLGIVHKSQITATIEERHSREEHSKTLSVVKR